MQKTFGPKVFQLGYVALGTPNVEGAKQHYQNLGMTEVERGAMGQFICRSATAITTSCRPAAQKALLHVGLQLKPHIAVGKFACDVRQIGLNATIKDRQSVRRRRTRRGRGAGRPSPILRCDRGSGTRLQATGGVVILDARGHGIAVLLQSNKFMVESSVTNTR